MTNYVRENFVSGVLKSGGIATAVATTMASDGLVNLPEVVLAESERAVIILDPFGRNGRPELVLVSDHAPGADTATIIRGQAGTTARPHVVGMTWLHGFSVEEIDQQDATIGGLVTDVGALETAVDALEIATAPETLASTLFPIGIIMLWTMANYPSGIPDGWLLCDGSAVDRTDYADLFALIGELYGEGDNVTTFNLPNTTTTPSEFPAQPLLYIIYTGVYAP